MKKQLHSICAPRGPFCVAYPQLTFARLDEERLFLRLPTCTFPLKGRGPHLPTSEVSLDYHASYPFQGGESLPC